MPRTETNKYMPSLIHRLVEKDADGATRTEPRWSLDRVLQSVCHDLEALLNSRPPARDPRLDEYDELTHSILNYGLPDITSLSSESRADIDLLRSRIRAAIAAYEPRLRQVQVHFNQDNHGTEALHFKIEAVLAIEPAPAHIVFNTALDLVNGNYQVEEGA